MGNNQAFTIFEATLLACYNHGVLTKPLLSDILESYRGTDVDSGGMVGTLTKDGRFDVIDVVITVWENELPARPQLSKDWRQWTDAEAEADEKWQDAHFSAFSNITRQFGW